MTASLTPVSSTTRIGHLDVLRGFALLGILLMNIQSFSMPLSAYLNPSAYGDFSGWHFGVWAVSHLLADSKFMGLFSVLFGAGICLFADRAEAKSGHSTRLHYQRNGWLLLFGLIHAHVIWYGDILYSYAMCSFWLYWLRRWSVNRLLISAFVVLAVGSIYSLFVHYVLNNGYMSADEISAIQAFWTPSPNTLLNEINAYTGSWLSQQSFRHHEALMMESDVFLSTFLWRASGMMLLGMALFKNGLLTGQRSQQFYRRLTISGLTIGLSITGWGLWQLEQHQFSLEFAMFGGSQFNYWGSVFMTLGYIGAINYAINGQWLQALQQRLAAVGQMALSNYMAQSVIATLIFYGHGFALFGHVNRVQLLLVVFGVWTLQLLYSPWWLKRFYFGPLEWLWRCLTYRQLQPFKRKTDLVQPKY